MSTDLQTCEVVLPGYVLTERIGSGGYAEVWRAEAPGGIEKAVKIVYGHYDDEFASQELKALERIKGVRHPFLLSLERFEILNGRLAILTELADMSLEQRLRQCRAEGRNGIPRDELLRYMADAAEALDFLSQRHNLLHLDIKPENLLILGDHIKVADFGLVKELATRTQNSLVSGMTPTYASPEMFDDDPSACSDQYSLAIVYQEMLVGSLPFPGRTVAQLAKQHTQAEPQLMSLPAEDRSIVAKALAKKPTDRFPSCRAFVDALRHHVAAIPVAPPAELPRHTPTIPRPSTPSPDDTKPSSLQHTLPRTPAPTAAPDARLVTQPIGRASSIAPSPQPAAVPAPEPFVPEERVDVAAPEINVLLQREQPTLYIAVGGVGIQVLSRIRALTAAKHESNSPLHATETIAIDTDRDELREACSSRWKTPLSSEDTLHLPLRLSNAYDDSREILNWVSRRWLYNIPRSLETRGYRPLGRIALVDHAQHLRTLVDRKLERLATLAGSKNESGEVRDDTIRIVLLAGTGGGTGSGTVMDIANAARSLARTQNLKIEVHGFFVLSYMAANGSSPLVAANTYALLQELNHASANGNQTTSEKVSKTQLFESAEAPFDCIYLLPAHSRGADAQPIDVLDTAARCLALEETPEARTILRSCRVSSTPREQSRGNLLTFKKLGYSSLADHKRRFVHDLAVDLAAAVKRYWLSPDRSADWPKLVRDEQEALITARLNASTTNAPQSSPQQPHANDVSPLALRGRFKDQMSLTFTSEVLQQIQRLLATRDDRNRPMLTSPEAKLIADTAYAAAVALAVEPKESNKESRFIGPSDFQHLVVAAGRRTLSRAIETFDMRHPERFLSCELAEGSIQAECVALLEENLVGPGLADKINALIDHEKSVTLALESTTTTLFQCGSDRRTFLFTPQVHVNKKLTESLLNARPLAAVVPTSLEDAIIISEESGISPRSIALGLERVYPGIAEAAGRLHTRIDIQWKTLI